MNNDKFIELLNKEENIKCPKCTSFAKKTFQDYSQWIYRCDRCGNQHIIDYIGFSFQFNGEEVDKEYITF
jgi:DNA-directed RNA polymerase subunit RPC12/RpoP